MIDWRRVNELKAEIGAEDLAEVMELFQAEVAEVLAKIESAPKGACQCDDLHFLRSSALNIGFRALAQLADEAEQECTKVADAAVVADLKTCFADSQTALNAGEISSAA